MELYLDHISKKYKDKVAVDDVSLRLTPGVWGLLGANGAGKTTLMRMIAGIMRPTAGQVKYDGLPITELKEKYRDRFGYLPQDFGFYPEFTVKGYLYYVAALKGLTKRDTKRKVEELLEQMTLTEVQNKKIVKLSGGMKRRVGIAQALLNEPEVLVLDEPTSGLDPVVRSEILDIFLEFISDGERSILVSSHITSDLERIADYITFIHQGKVLLSENKDEILYGYGIAKAGREQLHRVDRTLVAAIQDTPYGSEALILDRERFEREYPDIVLDPVDFDEMMVLLCRGQKL